MFIKKDDLVEIIAGKDRGKRGKVMRVIEAPDTYSFDKIIVEGINIRTIHRKPTREKAGARISEPGPLAASNAQVVCPHCDAHTRIAHQGEARDKQRTCKKCGKTFA